MTFSDESFPDHVLLHDGRELGSLYGNQFSIRERRKLYIDKITVRSSIFPFVRLTLHKLISFFRNFKYLN